MFLPAILPTAQLIPSPGEFRHPSLMHGQRHVGRVMVHAFRLLDATGFRDEATRLWAAVYLHDLARSHDGRCYVHGASAVQRFASNSRLQALFVDAGVVEADHDAIFTAVTRHSQPEELPREHTHWTLTSLLKDADGLDRVRFGDLDPRYLRWRQAAGMVPFAEQLYQGSRTLPEGAGLFAALADVAVQLERDGL